MGENGWGHHAVFDESEHSSVSSSFGLVPASKSYLACVCLLSDANRIAASVAMPLNVAVNSYAEQLNETAILHKAQTTVDRLMKQDK